MLNRPNLWTALAIFVALTAGTPRLARAQTPPVVAEAFDRGLRQGLTRIPEIRFVREQAKALGLRVWFFGGTAASFAHYVKWDLQRQAGDPRFQKDRFDYDYTNIFRSTQDLDIVVDTLDGKPDPNLAKKAAQLEAALARNYPHLQGSKSAWEARLLRQTSGNKQAVLDNPDFHNQMTDSHSTGLIELTDPGADPIVRDTRDWGSQKPQFLQDVLEERLHYYSSDLHFQTSRYREGLNPPIFSAIRYLTKAVQFELKLRPEDLAKIQQVIRDFDPARDLAQDYTKKWIEKNGKKLIQNALNVEYAAELLDRLGLRGKLRALSDPKQVESLGWWMSKEPLRTQKVGLGTGRTAREIFETAPGEPIVVAHETRSMLAYEAITRAHTGEPNVLVSRKDAPGEAAVHGNGFYTRLGRAGAVGTGLTIRFTVDPNAREGEDFMVASGDFVIWKNRAALRVIPESLNFTPVQYLQTLSDGQSFGFNHTDRALLEKLKRKVHHQLGAADWFDQAGAGAIAEIREVIRQHIAKDGDPSFWNEWLSLPISARMPEIVDLLLDTGGPRSHYFLRRLDRTVSFPDPQITLRRASWKAIAVPERLNTSFRRLVTDPRHRSELLRTGQNIQDNGFNLWAADPQSLHEADYLVEFLFSPHANNYSAFISNAISTQPHWREALKDDAPLTHTPIGWVLKYFILDSHQLLSRDLLRRLINAPSPPFQAYEYLVRAVVPPASKRSDSLDLEVRDSLNAFLKRELLKRNPIARALVLTWSSKIEDRDLILQTSLIVAEDPEMMGRLPSLAWQNVMEAILQDPTPASLVAFRSLWHHYPISTWKHLKENLGKYNLPSHAAILGYLVDERAFYRTPEILDELLTETDLTWTNDLSRSDLVRGYRMSMLRIIKGIPLNADNRIKFSLQGAHSRLHAAIAEHLLGQAEWRDDPHVSQDLEAAIKDGFLNHPSNLRGALKLFDSLRTEGPLAPHWLRALETFVSNTGLMPLEIFRWIPPRNEHERALAETASLPQQARASYLEKLRKERGANCLEEALRH